ncbi:PREDICTED: fas apoptotic inhibitory molecule 1 [Nicrophorus vespilloides]|uniref:Fas apoptotic inhibitory molecule 1 n=1 Tax=Nicrophorus vespilloides TaxID=110193 RepID=A0ABM1NIF6_NICVS|nr:PREDICTED: fas apoptotic inhibitory molecule 1 [Nicrophorus vespilloides]
MRESIYFYSVQVFSRIITNPSIRAFVVRSSKQSFTFTESNDIMALSGSLAHANSHERSDLVAYWSVPLCDGVHTVEFEHGSTSGKRVLRVDGKEILRREWMFKLVGDEKFTIGSHKTKCELRVDPLPHFTFSYSLVVDGKPLEKFLEKQNKSLRTWAVLSNGKRYRVVFEKQTLNIWVNGNIIDAENVFVQNGTEMRFKLGEVDALLRSSAIEKQGILHHLYLQGNRVEEDGELPHWKR